MRARGINYDTGFLPGSDITRKAFDPGAVRRDMEVIAGELHCEAVRISGREPARLSVAAECAAAAGLEIWFAPFPVDLPPVEMLAHFADCAQRAEAVRRGGSPVVLVAGCEISAFGTGFIPGTTFRDRLAAMGAADEAWWRSLGPVIERLNAFLAQAAETVRGHFGGRVTYAAGPWEFVDWTPFDIVGVDAYRAAYNKDTFREEMREHFKHGKPVAVTEFGTCAYRGAAELGGMAWQPPAGAVRDEGEQARYFAELLGVFEKVGVDAAFWFTFAGFHLPGDADIASYGVVRMIDETRWEPKRVFHTMADAYARH